MAWCSSSVSTISIFGFLTSCVASAAFLMRFKITSSISHRFISTHTGTKGRLRETWTRKSAVLPNDSTASRITVLKSSRSLSVLPALAYLRTWLTMLEACSVRKTIFSKIECMVSASSSPRWLRLKRPKEKLRIAARGCLSSCAKSVDMWLTV